MRTLLPDPLPAEVQALLERRRRWGAATRDEVWEGVYHVVPAPHDRHADVQAQIIELLGPLARATGLRPRGELNIGGPDDFRVPDAALLAPGPGGIHLPTAALVVEIVSPNDQTWEKLPFYAAQRVEEILILDPGTRKVHWLALADAQRYEPIERSRLIEMGPAELTRQIDWP